MAVPNKAQVEVAQNATVAKTVTTASRVVMFVVLVARKAENKVNA
jgi:hypothetical protein